MGRRLRLLSKSESVKELIWQRLWPPNLPPSLGRSRADPPRPQISQNVQDDQRAAAPGLSPAGSPQRQGCQHMAFSLLFPHSQLPTLCRGRSICLLGSDVKMHLHPLPPLGQQRPLHAPLSFLRLFPHPFLPLSQTPSSLRVLKGLWSPHSCTRQPCSALFSLGTALAAPCPQWRLPRLSTDLGTQPASAPGGRTVFGSTLPRQVTPVGPQFLNLDTP